MPFADSNGVKVYYEDSGRDGEVLFLTHGFGSSSSFWDHQMNLTTCFRIVRWDMRGHGRSDSPDDPGQYSKQHQVADMEAVLDSCGVGQAIFLGHSMGAYDSMLFYLSSPHRAKRVKALILFGTGPGFAKEEARAAWNSQADKLAEAYSARGLEALVGSDRTKGHTERGVRVGLAHSARNVYGQRAADPLYASLPEGPAVVARRLPEIRVPVLILVGERDKPFHAASEMMRAKLPNARLVRIPGAGHLASESHPELFNEQVLHFAGAFASRL